MDKHLKNTNCSFKQHEAEAQIVFQEPDSWKYLFFSVILLLVVPI